MPKLTVDGIEYNTEDLDDYGVEQLYCIQFIDRQLEKIESQVKTHEYAQNVYISHLKKVLDSA